MLVGIHPNLGPTLLGQAQPDVCLSIQHASLIDTKGDGHCLLYAVGESIHNYLGINIPHHDIIKYTANEITTIAAEYALFLSTGITSIEHYANDYFIRKKWNNDFGGIIPLAIAYAFSLKIIVLSPAGFREPMRISPWFNYVSSPYIIIFLDNGYYSSSRAVIPSTPILCSSQTTSLRQYPSPSTIKHSDNFPVHAKLKEITPNISSSPTPSVQCLPNLDDRFTGTSWNFPSSHLLLVHCNVQGLLGAGTKRLDPSHNHNKLNMLRHLLNLRRSPEVFCISESKLSSKISNAEIQVDGYEVFRKDRTRNGGGVLIYCKSGLCPRKILLDIQTSVEAVAVKLSFGNKPFIVCCVYRPSNSTASWLNDFTNVVNFISLKNCFATFLGDFNVDLLKTTDLADELHEGLGLHQHIKSLTRITSSTATLIDHIYSNNDSFKHAGIFNLGLADHLAIYGCIDATSINKKDAFHSHLTATFRRFKGFDCGLLQQAL